MLEAVEIDGNTLKYASKELRNDPKFVMAVLRKNGAAFIYASRQLRKDPVFVLEAMHNNMHAFIGPALSDNELKALLKKKISVGKYISKGSFKGISIFFDKRRDDGSIMAQSEQTSKNI